MFPQKHDLPFCLVLLLNLRLCLFRFPWSLAEAGGQPPFSISIMQYKMRILAFDGRLFADKIYWPQ